MCLLRGTDWIFICNSTFCPHSVFMCFVWIGEQTAIISLYSINWLVFITETESVYCAVRTGSFHFVHHKSSRSIQVKYVLESAALGQVFPRVLQFSPSVSFHQCPTAIFSYISVSQPPGRGSVPVPGINIPGRERPEETTVCYKISLVQLITNLNVILYLSTCHTVYISVLILFMIMP